MKLTPEELQAKVSKLSKSGRGKKRKAQTGFGSSPATRAKTQKLEESTPSSTTKEQTPLPGSSQDVPTSSQGVQPASDPAHVEGQASPSLAEIERSLEVIPLLQPSTVNYSPSGKLLEASLAGPKSKEGKRPQAEKDEESLLEDSWLAAEAITSVLPESDVRKATFMDTDESIASALHGAATVSLDTFIHFCHLILWFKATDSHSFAFSDGHSCEGPLEQD